MVENNEQGLSVLPVHSVPIHATHRGSEKFRERTFIGRPLSLSSFPKQYGATTIYMTFA